MLATAYKLLLPISRIGADPADNDELRFRKIIGVTTVLLGGVPLQVGLGVLYLSFHEPLAGWTNIVCGVLMLLTVFTFAFTRQFNAHNLFWLLITLIGPFLTTIFLGGFALSGFVIIWAMLTPLISLVTNRPQNALIWFLLFCGELVIVGIVQPSLRSGNNFPPTMVNSLTVVHLFFASTLFLLSLYYFVNQNSILIRLLQQEQDKSETLLLNILPKEIAAILKNENRIIADQYDEASVLFADMVGFTPLSAKLPPVEMVELLNEAFSFFDSLLDKYGLEKIRTIGDSYMVASGVPRGRPDHAGALVRMALEMRDYVSTHTFQNGHHLSFRIGINSGSMVAGVIGRRKFVYDVWGDAVNVASRMESHGVPGQIQITSDTYDLIKDSFICKPRGVVSIKGKGDMKVWHVQSEKI
jgi:adenylate cyclase